MAEQFPREQNEIGLPGTDNLVGLCRFCDHADGAGGNVCLAPDFLGMTHLVAGLDLDFRAMPFGEMLNLTWLVNAYGGSITECMAYCACGARALYSQRLIDGKPAPYDSSVKMPGDAYEPRCAEHFVLPGRPH
jgi:thymidine kinase